jgi:hypothetical protein
MSALGHKRTSKHARPMSALPPKADIVCRNGDVRFVPIPEQVPCSNFLFDQPLGELLEL